MFNPPTTRWLPDWAAGAVFYHIYPLGFLGAPLRNDGGDKVPRLAELRRWYDHVAGLGVTAIYFGPLFESQSHGYDTTDYFSVDRRLGDNALLRVIIDELHERGIKVIFDGVFRHTGRDFFAFADIRRNGRSSPYVDWYNLNWAADSEFGDGFGYDSWQGFQGLPKLNLANPDTRKYIFEVARNWLGDYRADGWRLDVAHDIDPDFWWEFRRVCKEANPDCFLVGELARDDYRVWVAPDLLDSGTNYQLYESFKRSFTQHNLADLRANLERASHPEFGVFKDLSLMTFLGNHDQTRVLTALKDRRHMYPALIFLLTAPGIPCLYYGDEVGMVGDKDYGDEGVRQPMPLPDADWPDANHDLYRETARLVALRKQHPALAYGSLIALDAGPTTLAYLRQHSREWVIAVLNIGDKAVRLTLPLAEAGVPDGVVFTDALESSLPDLKVQHGKLANVEVQPGWGRILVASTGFVSGLL